LRIHLRNLTKFYDAVPLSAFAVTRARKASQQRRSEQNGSDNQALKAQGNEPLELIHNAVEANAILGDLVQNATHRNDAKPWEPINLDYDSEAGMTSDQNEDQGDIASSELNITLNKELSTWRPSDGNISNTKIGQRIHMNYGQTLVILGQFDLNIHSGVINVYGTFLGSKSPIQRIVSPSTEPLPSIRCVSSDGAEIDLLNVPADESFENLGRISGLFQDIWSCKCPNCQELGYQFTFRKVCLPFTIWHMTNKFPGLGLKRSLSEA
jgi:hypothetical protein